MVPDTVYPLDEQAKLRYVIRRKLYRKLLLDAGSEALKIKGGD